MVLKRRAALGGVQLDSLDSRIIITGIDEAAGKETITAVSTGAGPGQRVTLRKRETLDVTVRFAMKIKNSSMSARSTLLDTVNAWAGPGGWLTLGHRDGKRLNVLLAQAPGGGDQYQWTNDYTILFRAYGVPYWEDSTETTQTLSSGSVQSGFITVPGNTETVGEVTVKNISGSTISTVNVQMGSSLMTFGSLSLANGSSLVIDHIHTADLYCVRAKIGSTSVLGKRSGADDFYVNPGTQGISVSASGSVQATYSVRGRYL